MTPTPPPQHQRCHSLAKNQHRCLLLDSRGISAEAPAMAREIKLDGGEITLLKQIGITGSHVSGKVLLEHSDGMLPAEFLDTLESLISLGYVLSSKVSVRTIEDVERSTFQVNPSYARDIKEALHPSRNREEKRTRRVRRG